MKTATQEMIDERAQKCDCCYEYGVLGSGEGEIVIDGTPYAIPLAQSGTPAGELAAGTAPGHWQDLTLCRACADGVDRAELILRVTDDEGTLPAVEAVEIFHGKPTYHSAQPVALALKRAHISQHCIDTAADLCGWADASQEVLSVYLADYTCECGYRHERRSREGIPALPESIRCPECDLWVRMDHPPSDQTAVECSGALNSRTQ